MIVLGIDPGYATVGYGAIEAKGGKCRYITHGVITTKQGPSLAMRLNEIYADMGQLIASIRPDAVAMEQLFFNTNQKTALFVAHARGVLLLSAAKSGFEPYEYTPLQVKMAVCGYGRAQKKQVQEMVKTLLRLGEIPKPDDAADALAVAICHGISGGSALHALR